MIYTKDHCASRAHAATAPPDYRVSAGNVEFGAAWKKTFNQSRDYPSVKLSAPSFPAPICATLVEGEDETHTMIWSRRNGD